MTGHDVRREEDRPTDSLSVLFSDQFAGKMTYLDEMRDTIGLSALNLGFDPASLTQEQFDAVAGAGRARPSRTAGSARSWATQYTEDYGRRRGGPGDRLVRRHRPHPARPDQTQDFKWVLAKRAGCSGPTTWRSRRAPRTSCWPSTGSTSTTTRTNAAVIEAYVNYVCPVKGAREVMLTLDPALANNPLIFPPADWVARLHQFRDTTAEEEFAWAKAFTKAAGL